MKSIGVNPTKIVDEDGENENPYRVQAVVYISRDEDVPKELIKKMKEYDDMHKTLKLNDEYTWDTISSTYPDMYALITNVKMEGGAIKTCTLLDVCSFEEKAHYVEKYLKKGIKFSCERTTFLMPTLGSWGSFQY